MLSIKIKNAHDTDFRATDDQKLGKVLDAIWKEGWLRDCISQKDSDTINEAIKIADEIKGGNQNVIVIAEKRLATILKGIISAGSKNDSKPNLIITSGSFSAIEYEDIFELCSEGGTALLPISLGKERIELRAAYAIYKKFVADSDKENSDRLAVRSFCKKQSNVILNEGIKSKDIVSYIDDSIDIYSMASTLPTLVVLSLAGLDIEKYISGFYEMVTSMDWDRSFPFIGKRLSEIQQADALNEEVAIYIWQQEYEDLAYACQFLQQSNAIKAMKMKLPEDDLPDIALKKKRDKGKCMEIHIYSLEGNAELMTPIFDGCNSDGSLELLVREQAGARFSGEDEREIVQIEIDRTSDYTAGELAGFLQITNKIMVMLNNIE